MPLTERQIRLVQFSFEKITENIDQSAALFYDHLFHLDPSLKAMFKGDMRQQGRKLMQTLLVAVNGLDDFGAVAPSIRELGKRHVNYGVQPKHYELVGTALLWMVEQGIGNQYTSEICGAWTQLYDELKNVAIQA
jgi:nitric oxide dioxygenase